MAQQEKPTIVVESDYDGYFESLVKNLVAGKQGEFEHSKIVVTAGPWRPYAATTRSDGDTIHIDFYSALRTGFGSLSEEDLEGLRAKL